jgi:hypothetical protein
MPTGMQGVTSIHDGSPFPQGDKQMLRHLKDYGNRFVHESAENTAIETCIYQLKNYIEELLSFHLNHSFRSLSEACEFLDLPSDRDILNKQIQSRRDAKRFLRYT